MAEGKVVIKPFEGKNRQFYRVGDEDFLPKDFHEMNKGKSYTVAPDGTLYYMPPYQRPDNR